MGRGAYQYHYHPPPHGLSTYPNPSFGVDLVRTLFVAGLPNDVKPRELHNLFADFPGFLSSKLNFSSQGNGFVVFSDQPSALAALRAVNKMVFDPEQNSTLHVDLAKSNSRPKRARTADIAGQWDKKLRGFDATPKALLDHDIGGYDHKRGMQNTGHTYPSFQSLRSTDHQGNDSFDIT